MANELESTENTATQTEPYNGLIPPEGHSDVGKRAFALFEICKKAKKKGGWHEKWLKNHELIRGKHFPTTQSKYPMVPINLFHVAFSTTVANLTDNKPKFDIVPHDDRAKAKQPILHEAASTWWRRTNQQGKLTATVKNKEKYGTTIEKMLFDTSLRGGRGEIDVAIVDPFKFFPWPNIQDIQRMPRFFEIEIMDLEDIYRMWPESGKTVAPDSAYSELVGKEREEVRGGTQSRNTFPDNLPSNYAEDGGRDSKEYNLKRAMVYEMWLKDYTMVPIFEQQQVFLEGAVDNTGQPIPAIDEFGQPITQEVEAGEKPKYPGFIRVIHFANSGKVVLDDVPNPSLNPNLPEEQASQTYLWDRYPYQNSDSNTDDTNFWGYSGVEQVETLVLQINKKVSQIAAYIDKTARPTLIMPMNAGIEKHQISNLPGQTWWPVNHMVAQYIRYLAVPPLPSDFYKYIELLLRLVDIVTGIHEVTEGRRPTGVTAASAIMALQEKAETIFREKIRNNDALIEERGRMWVGLAQNWYNEPRKLQMSGKNASAQGEFQEYRAEDFIEGEFSFTVVSGSTMPKSIFTQQEHAIQLFQSGVIDQREILEKFNWANIEEVIQRMSQGPLGQLIERLETAGLPQEVLQVIQEIGSMDENEYKQAFGVKPSGLGGKQLPPAQAGE